MDDQDQEDTTEDAPPPGADCTQGKYLLAVTYECGACGAKVALVSKDAVLAALNNAGLRMKCGRCGEWLFLGPGQKMQIEPTPRKTIATAEQADNRQARRAHARAVAKKFRSMGGIILPS
ncbi:MAG TPA: hypothetical protein ENH33_07240 [Actinobacteria bacterium]|nr:hypothetical protein [Actinomycetota bacterium]